MNLFMRNVPSTVDDIGLTLILQPLIHDPSFEGYSTSSSLPINFKVHLFRDKKFRRSRHSGQGTLTLPGKDIGDAFLRRYGRNQIKVDGQYISIQTSNKTPRPEDVEEVRRLPYRDPRAIRDWENRLADLSGSVELKDVQFTWLCRDDKVSIEWQWDQEVSETFGKFLVSGPASYKLLFNDETREVVVQRTELFQAKTIVVRYSHIRGAETDSTAKTILFHLKTPPSFEGELFAEVFPNSISRRTKLTHLNAAHALVAPFTCTTLRLICSSLKDLAEFKRMAELANIHVSDYSRRALPGGLFGDTLLRRKQDWLSHLPWSVAFQCDALHKDLLLDTVELLDLRPGIDELVQSRGAQHATLVLRQLGLRLRDLWNREEEGSVQSCFKEAKDDIDIEQNGVYSQPPSVDGRHFQCLHVNFTPTGMRLRGPFLDVSNRIIRQYPRNQDAFLRVSFTDEDGHKFRFDREVDGTKFIEERVGTILKTGFELCGRRFEFLAYSQSALKQYVVWFVTPFTDSQGRRVNAASIREGIGSAWPEGLRRCPARFAARLSQAFTATESTFFVEPEQVFRIPDIERNGYCFSDGNGHLSPEIMNAIQEALQRNSGQTRRGTRAPSVVQVRIQGAKGVLSVDPTLADLRIEMRPSMIKFESLGNYDIEIARSFDKPGRLFLNRPFAMILAGLGVDIDVFLQLQQDAVDDAKESTKSLPAAARLFDTHGLGSVFALPSTFLNLSKLGLELEPEVTTSGLRDESMERCLQFAVHHVLREIKYKARVPVPECWKLVGVVDNHNILEKNQIYACIIKGEGANREYLRGPILISKSPTIHPGDVQIAEAIGKPPQDSPLHSLHNCVVFSQRGDRPLPNKLSGSDLDGDEYDLVTLPALHPPKTVNPGEYAPAPRLTLERDCTIEDVAKFVVDFINNDKLGIVATNFLLIADLYGIFAPECQKLAELHSWAVDFPKNGVPVPSQQIPQPLVRDVRPDWSAPEISTHLDGKHYKSESVLGKMFRAIELPPLSKVIDDPRARKRRQRKTDGLSLVDTIEQLSLSTEPHRNTITMKLRRKLVRLVDLEDAEEIRAAISSLFDLYASELEHICFSYTLSRKATARLTEEEVLVGTITAKSAQPRVRQDNISSMREETTALVGRMWRELEGGENATSQDWVNRSWAAWKLSLTEKNSFGAKSFGWIALRSIFEAIKFLED